MKKMLDFMQGRFCILWCIALLLLMVFSPNVLLARQEMISGELDRTQQKSIVNLLKNKTASEKSQIKSAEISKYDFEGVYDDVKYGVRVEIVGNPTPIEVNGQHGIELFARAWRGTQQLGFGADGSVEIERFRIFNPPVLVDDPNGTVVREWTDEEDGELKQRKLREDPFEAIRQTIAHNANLVGIENAPIVLGKIGNTTSTFYPDADPESTSVDGLVGRANVAVSSWGDIRDGDGTYVEDSAVTNRLFDFDSSFTTDKWSKILRGIHLFDTSAIPDTDTIDSATLSFYGQAKVDQGLYAADVNVYSSTPAF